MLKELLRDHELIEVGVEAKDWKDAVKHGVEVLANEDFVEIKYADSIIESTLTNGPYYVIAPGLALPHSSAEDGVKKIGLSIITLKEPVEFNHENDPVDILITLSAKDRNTHLEMMTELVNILIQEDFMDNMRKCKSKEEIREMFLKD